MPKWRDFFSVDDGRVTVSLESLEKFVSEKAEELAARLEESRSDAESFLRGLKEDISSIHSLHEGLGAFPSGAREYVDAKAEALTAKLEGVSSQLEQISLRLDDVSAEIQNVASQAAARFSNIEARLDELVSDDAAAVQLSEGGDLDPVDGKDLPGEEEVLPGDEGDLDLSFLEATSSSGDTVESDVPPTSVNDDLPDEQEELDGQDSDEALTPELVGISSSNLVAVSDDLIY